MIVNLSDIICDTFVDVVDDIVGCKVGRMVLKGGRASTKSQTASESILIGCMQHKQSAVALVKYGNKIKDRLVDTFSSSIEYLGVQKYWKLRKSPYEYVLLDAYGHETDVSIKFTGADNADNLKSFRPRKGSFRYVWFEELTNFSSIKEVNNIIQTMARGSDVCVIMSYNPPESTSSWVNKEYEVPCGVVLGHKSNTYTNIIKITTTIDGVEQTFDVLQKVHHSSYLDVVDSNHAEWLGIQWLAEAEQAKKNNPTYYKWCYLGEVTGTDANVFRNIHDWKYVEDYDGCLLHRGLDVSNGGPDPWAWGTWYYDRIKNDLYCLTEFKLAGTSTISDVASNIRLVNKTNREYYIDSAVPTFARQLQTAGTNAVPVKKGAYNSVEGGILWLKSCNHIFIDKIKTPFTYKEFKEYEYKINRYDEITTELVDANNHSIDACRYACSNLIIDSSYARK
jgi:PBSX family phage terminase large subunit